VVSEEYSDIPQYLQLVQSQVSAAGIELSIEIMSQAEYYGTEGHEPWLEVAFGSTDWGERATPSASVTPAYLTGAPFNESHYSNPAFDTAMQAYDGTLDPQERELYAIEAATIIHDDVPSIIAFFPQQIRVASTKVHGLSAGPISQLYFSGVTVD
jgi:peptide/nickel transport system substrate-binding protein